MTEIKIPFTKLEVKKIIDDKKPANMEGLELQIIPIFIDKFYEKIPLESCLNKIKLVFFDGAEKEIYNNLLDDNKEKFELSFEKEKVDFYVVGVEDREVDDTKIEINYFAKGGNDSLEIFFKPQFAGVVKITPTSQNDNGKDRPTDDRGNNNNGDGDKTNQDNSEFDKKIANLQSQINELEKKQQKTPNSNTNQQDKQDLARLKRELAELKRKQKNKSQNEKGQTKKDNFPYGLVIGGGIVIVILLIAVIFFWRMSKKKQN